MDHNGIEWDDASDEGEQSSNGSNDGCDDVYVDVPHEPIDDPPTSHDTYYNDPFLQNTDNSHHTETSTASILNNIPVIELQHIPRITKRQFKQENSNLLDKRKVIKTLMRRLQDIDNNEANPVTDADINAIIEQQHLTAHQHNEEQPVTKQARLSKEDRIAIAMKRRLDDRKRGLVEWRILVKGVNKKRQAIEDVVTTHLSTTPAASGEHRYTTQPTPSSSRRQTRSRASRGQTHLDLD